ncbi:toxin-antitoxin system HicB family antitoxin [Halochromatium roseum]|uniref:toxin-antitoxin system HicB family antitoxin n=1 Tax=Halochromatium roseum TaxID=391920 RepID=UPI0019139AF6|nr:toxin-antitoxin system HicB family antitoxin [Halochromatium roseum]MBK5939800.1 hypothetical protein [Halochromatium roseum]
MSTLTINIPDSLIGRLQEFAVDQGITVDQLLSSAAAEKLSTLMTVDGLRERGSHGDRAAYKRFLDSSADAPPIPGDEL